MDLNRFTEKSQEALRDAQALATRRNHQGVDVEHLLTALLEEYEGLAAALLAAAGIAPSAVCERVEQELNRIPWRRRLNRQEIQFCGRRDGGLCQ